MKTRLNKAIVVIPFALTMIVPSISPIYANDGMEQPQTQQQSNVNYEYNVSFDTSGIAVDDDSMPDAMNGLTMGTIEVPYDTPTAAGYTFQGWSTDADVSKGTIYQPGQYITVDPDNSTFTLYAVWDTNAPAKSKTKDSTDDSENYSYDINYIENNFAATGMPKEQKGKINDTDNTVSLSSKTPKFDGYTFQGWTTTEGSSTVEYAPGQTIAITQDTTLNLYAVWTQNAPTTDTYKFVINYDASGIAANNMPAQQSGSTDDMTNMISLSDQVPTAAGFTFQGWSATQNGTTVDYAPGTTIAINQDTTLNLYAVWTKDAPKQQVNEINYNIYFNSNIKVEKGMPERMSGVLQESQGNKVTLPTTTPVATGYTFVGWTTDKNGTKVEYKAGDAIAFKTGTSEVQNVQLYALWQKADGTSKASTVQTGTETNLGIYAGVTGVAAALLAAIGLKKKFNK